MDTDAEKFHGQKSVRIREMQTSRARPSMSHFQVIACRFLTGRPANTVITTFISHYFSRGPWTSVVQGPK